MIHYTNKHREYLKNIQAIINGFHLHNPDASNQSLFVHLIHQDFQLLKLKPNDIGSYKFIPLTYKNDLLIKIYQDSDDNCYALDDSNWQYLSKKLKILSRKNKKLASTISNHIAWPLYANHIYSVQLKLNHKGGSNIKAYNKLKYLQDTIESLNITDAICDNNIAYHNHSPLIFDFCLGEHLPTNKNMKNSLVYYSNNP